MNKQTTHCSLTGYRFLFCLRFFFHTGYDYCIASNAYSQKLPKQRIWKLRQSGNFQKTYQRKIRFIENSHFRKCHKIMFTYLLRELNQIFTVLSVSIEILCWSALGQLAQCNQRLTLTYFKRISSALSIQLKFTSSVYEILLNQTLRLVHEALEPHRYQSDRRFYQLFQPVSCNITRTVTHVTIPALFLLPLAHCKV